MSIKVEYLNGVFKPLETVNNMPSGARVRSFFGKRTSRSRGKSDVAEGGRKGFESWNNPEDETYDVP